VSRGCIPDYSGMSYEKLRATGGLQWPCNDANPGGAVRLYIDWHFPSHTNETETFEKDLGTGHELTLRTYRDRHDPEGRAVLISADYTPGPETPDEEYPFTAITGRLVYHWHTRTKTNKAPMLHEAAPDVFVSVNADDAAALVVEDGDVVRVRSRRGAVTAPIKVGDVVPRGVVFVPFHFGDLGEDSAANNLTSTLEDPVSKQPTQKIAAVRIERVRT
jgi:predicted molibdopterin-dependent oxidoreductase YjgC